MPRCPSCSREYRGSGRFCSWCAAPLTVTSVETEVLGAAASSPGLSSSTSVDEGRFVPGTMVAGRYRVAGLLGRGGMGEVYRATDLTLGQAVALKFLPEAASSDERALVRFYNEVRMARQVTHPNVCRVYDIGQVDGLHYISMEYVDGEDLASLLRRIGRLPANKALDTARRLCAGLAAAHEKGVLHRDLKPANIMIDGRGNVIIMDFGLAGLSEQLHEDVHSGTPAYMSPEQLAGTEVTARSDIYALGLVLYELFTGRRAFEASSLMDLIQMQERGAPPSLTSAVRDADPAVEQVIVRCLSHDPARRPSSALAVAAALPGGDPLAAALAAGETPSPDVVAAAGEIGRQRQWEAIAWLSAALVGIVLVGWWAARICIANTVRMEAPPEALTVQARNLLKSLGYTARPTDAKGNYAYDADLQTYLGSHKALADDFWAHPPTLPSFIEFWYRESPRPLFGTLSFNTYTAYNDPPFEASGMIRLRMSPDGELRQLEALPPQLETSSAAPVVPDWSPLFRLSGLDSARFQTAAPEWLPPGGWDARAAWTGSDPRITAPLRVEAAAWRGRPVFFRIVGPWSRPERDTPPSPNPRPIRVALPYAMLAVAIVLAWKNIREGKADLRGGGKLAFLCFTGMAAGHYIASPHVAGDQELSIFWRALSVAFTNAAPDFICYISLEPWVRKLWPQILIPWSRYTTRGLRDPLVGRDLLAGAVFGSILTAFNLIANVATGGGPWAGAVSISGIRPFIGFLGDTLAVSIFDPSVYFFLLFLCRVIFRKEWLTTVVFVGAMTLVIGGVSDPAHMLPIGLAFACLYAFVLLRFGFLALIMTSICAHLLLAIPRTLDSSLWYAGLGAAPLVIVALIAAWGYRTTLGIRDQGSGIRESNVSRSHA
jgi:predicted Ser/Thr protein kinase